ncbi:mannitol dehydrogenase family protein [Umezawaea endophytica]|uniref:Mannitol-1-phosphate 5-dehydrogenase n=1 Tax=Umezawaea endophytica TaxID=1654476 RepID=A0A9X3AKX5_9PSEU|nr:mannitol dehydrogenase family protein [Umezawaea endophytica]MCS7483555.1 mannitol dehydrogenase family protein [Umezawaea endophytica]
MTRLTATTARDLAPALRPLVDPGASEPRIVHFGLGAFHRAHQAVYTEAAAARTGEPWGITVVAPRSETSVAALRAQDCLYSVTERHPDGPRTRVVGSIVGALLMRRDAAEVDALLAAPATTVVTLTITEKGYHRRPGTTDLDTAAPEIAADLVADAGDQRTAVARLAGGLAARYRAHGAPISVVSCDNATANGAVLRGVVRGFVEASPWPDRRALLAWLDESVAFPSTVVDRIVPATTDEDEEAASAALGLRDRMPVVGEPYRQWVLEDSFTAARPAWELDGAVLTGDVAPYQSMKLRLLNGSHSALAYLGLAAGHGSVRAVLHTTWGERFVRDFGAEVARTLPEGGPDATAYVEDLVRRFRNPAMRHLLRQIGSDGSLKIPERWFGALREARGDTPLLELALAGWVNSTRPDDRHPVFGTTDPLAEPLARCWYDRPDHVELVARLLHLVGAPDLAERADLVKAVAARLPALRAGRIEL